MTTETRICTKCEQEKPIDEFPYKRKHGARHVRCKICINEACRESRQRGNLRKNLGNKVRCASCRCYREKDEFRWLENMNRHAKTCNRCRGLQQANEQMKIEKERMEFYDRVREEDAEDAPDPYGDGYSDGVREFAMAVIPMMPFKRRKVLTLAKEFGAKINFI